MHRTRLMSVVEGTWGRGTIYTDEQESEKSETELETHNQMSIKSDIQIYDPTSAVEVEVPEPLQDYNCLEYFMSSMLGTILESSILQIRIISECSNEFRILKTMSEMGMLVTLKYDVKLPEVTDELDGIDVNNLGNEEYKIKKIYEDRNYLDGVLLSLYLDMSLNRWYQALQNHIQAILDRLAYRAFMVEDVANNKVILRETYKKLRLQRNHIMSVIYDLNANIDRLKSILEDASLNAEIRSRYVDNWQTARSEQHEQTIHDQESEYSTGLEYYKQRTEHEHRVHSEVELMVNIVINETLAKVEAWMDKYDKDMEAIDLKIQIEKNNYQNMLTKRRGLEETIESHDQKMKEWNNFKEEREKLRQYVEKMTKSAITVQAWWRGLLVRCELGPFKVAKKKGGKKK